MDLCYNKCALCEISHSAQLSQDWIITDFLFPKYLVVLFLQLCHAVSTIVKSFSSIFYADCFVLCFLCAFTFVYVLWTGKTSRRRTGYSVLCSILMGLYKFKSNYTCVYSHLQHWLFSIFYTSSVCVMHSVSCVLLVPVPQAPGHSVAWFFN